MAEVYRAQDTRLHRDVAVKVLPQSFATLPLLFANRPRQIAFGYAVIQATKDRSTPRDHS